MEELSGRKKDRALQLYLPKRSTVLVFCFVLMVFLSSQYHILDGALEAVLRDEVTGEFLKLDQFLLDMAIHFGYLVTAPLTGVFVVKSAQPKSIIIFGFVISSLATFYTPIAASSLFGMMWARAMTGAGLGMVVVAMFHLIAFWIPKQEYTRAVTFITSGYYAGMMFADLWGSVLVKVYSWQATFYWFGVVPLLFLALWSYVVAASPASHSKMTPMELSYLKANAIAPEGYALMLGTLIQSPVVWVLFVCNVLFIFGHTAIFSVIQFFLVDVLWIDLTFGALTMILLFFNLSSIIFDYLLRVDKTDSPTSKNSRRLREAVGGVGLIGCAIFLKLFCGSSHTASIRLIGFGVAMIFLATAYAGHLSAMFDVIPKHAALVIGFSFLPAALMNVWAHVGLRWVLDSTGNWSFVLSSIAASLSLCGILWSTWGSTERIFL